MSFKNNDVLYENFNGGWNLFMIYGDGSHIEESGLKSLKQCKEYLKFWKKTGSYFIKRVAIFPPGAYTNSIQEKRFFPWRPEDM